MKIAKSGKNINKQHLNSSIRNKPSKPKNAHGWRLVAHLKKLSMSQQLFLVALIRGASDTKKTEVDRQLACEENISHWTFLLVFFAAVPAQFFPIPDPLLHTSKNKFPGAFKNPRKVWTSICKMKLTFAAPLAFSTACCAGRVSFHLRLVGFSCCQSIPNLNWIC